MGIFGSSSRTYVSTSVARVVEDDLLPDILKTVPLKAILEEKPIGASIVDATLNSFAIKANRAFESAKRGDYYWGLPQHTFVKEAIEVSTLQPILENLIGEPVNIEYSYLSSLHHIHWAYWRIVNEYGYNPYTNELVYYSDLRGFSCYVENIVGVIDTRAVFEDDSVIEGNEITDPNVFAQKLWETAPNDRYTPWTNTEASQPNWEMSDIKPMSLRIEYAWDDGTSINKGHLTINFAFDVLDNNYVQAKYEYDLSSPDGPSTGYFIYTHGSGGIAALDALNAPDSTDNQFMPVVFFRHNRLNTADPATRNEDEYNSSVKLMNAMGMSFQDISEAIHSEENPDVDKVEEAVMMFGVPIDTQDKQGMKYLYHYWEWLVYNDPDAVSTYESMQALAESEVNRGNYISDGNFSLQINYGDITNRVLLGSPLNVGEYSVTVNEYDVSYTIWVTRIENDLQVQVPLVRTKKVTVHSFIKQLTANTYSKFDVGAIEGVYRVYGRDVIIYGNGEEGQLLIPVFYSIAKENFSLIELDRFMSFSLNLVFNSRVTKKIRWYETGIFKVFLFVVAAVITVLSVGAAAPGVAASFASLASTYGIIAATLILALKFITTQYIFNEAFRFVADKVGIEATLVLALVAAVVGVYGNQTNNVWAENLMSLSSGLTTGVSLEIQNELKELQEEYDAFNTLSEEKQRELETKIEELNSYSDFNPLDLFNLIPLTVPNETPDEFIHRTIGVNNIAEISFSAIENYVDSKLKLPDINDTLERFN